MQKRYEMKVQGIRGIPFFIGAILFVVLAAGLVLLLMTVGVAAFVVGAVLSTVAGLVLAVRRSLGLGGGRAVAEEDEAERAEAELFEVERESQGLDLGEGEIIDVEIEMVEEEKGG